MDGSKRLGGGFGITDDQHVAFLANGSALFMLPLRSVQGYDGKQLSCLNGKSFALEMAAADKKEFCRYVAANPKEQPIYASYDYEAQAEDELSIAEGEKLLLIRHTDDDWSMVKRADGSDCGAVPRAYIGDQLSHEMETLSIKSWAEVDSADYKQSPEIISETELAKSPVVEQASKEKVSFIPPPPPIPKADIFEPKSEGLKDKVLKSEALKKEVSKSEALKDEVSKKEVLNESHDSKKETRQELPKPATASIPPPPPLPKPEALAPKDTDTVEMNVVKKAEAVYKPVETRPTVLASKARSSETTANPGGFKLPKSASNSRLAEAVPPKASVCTEQIKREEEPVKLQVQSKIEQTPLRAESETPTASHLAAASAIKNPREFSSQKQPPKEPAKAQPTKPRWISKEAPASPPVPKASHPVQLQASVEAPKKSCDDVSQPAPIAPMASRPAQSLMSENAKKPSVLSLSELAKKCETQAAPTTLAPAEKAASSSGAQSNLLPKPAAIDMSAVNEAPNVKVASNMWSSLSIKKPAPKSKPTIKTAVPTNVDASAKKSLPDRPEQASSSIKPKPGNTRIWNDKTGKFQVEAEYLSFMDGQVHLLKLNGKKITVPVDLLSERDVEYVYRRERIPFDTSTGAQSTVPSGQGGWMALLLEIGVDRSRASGYSQTLAMEKLSEAQFTDLTRDFLKARGFIEADIMLFLKAAAKKEAQKLEQRAANANLQRVRSMSKSPSFEVAHEAYEVVPYTKPSSSPSIKDYPALQPIKSPPVSATTIVDIASYDAKSGSTAFPENPDAVTTYTATQTLEKTRTAIKKPVGALSPSMEHSRISNEPKNSTRPQLAPTAYKEPSLHDTQQRMQAASDYSQALQSTRPPLPLPLPQQQQQQQQYQQQQALESFRPPHVSYSNPPPAQYAAVQHPQVVPMQVVTQPTVSFAYQPAPPPQQPQVHHNVYITRVTSSNNSNNMMSAANRPQMMGNRPPPPMMYQQQQHGYPPQQPPSMTQHPMMQYQQPYQQQPFPPQPPSFNPFNQFPNGPFPPYGSGAYYPH